MFMGLRNAALSALAGLMLGAAPGYGQSLADVARMEAARRKAIKEGGKVYTNKDLPRGAPVAPTVQPVATSGTDSRARLGSSPSGRRADPAESATQPSQIDGQARPPGKEKDQTYWSERMRNLRDRLDRDQIYVDALQSRVNALSTDFVNRDDPVQRAQVATDRQRALGELERLKRQIADEKQAIADLEEEARGAGVPPGTLR
jgi:hypothetical protein